MQEPNLDPAPAPTPTRLWGLRDIAIVTIAILLLLVFVPAVTVLPASLIWEEPSDGETADATLVGETADGTSVGETADATSVGETTDATSVGETTDATSVEETADATSDRANTEAEDVALAVGNLLWYLTVIATVVGYVRHKGGTLSDLGLRRPQSGGRDSPGRLVAIAVVTFIAMYAVIIVYSLVALQLLDLDFLEPSEQIEDTFYDHKIALAILGISVVIGAPITEELFFRGFLFGGVRTYIPVALSALVTGFLFSILHFNVGLVIPFTLIGAILALSYQRSGNLATSIGAHFFFNFVSFMLLAFVPEAR